MVSVSKLVAVGFCLAPMIASAQTESGPWRFVTADTKAVISIDWSRIRKSHVGTLLREKFIDGAGVPGTQYLDNVDRFLVSSTGKSSDDPESDALLAVAIGHFDLARVRTSLAQYRVKPQKYGESLVYRPQGKNAKDLAFSLVDAQTILIGDSRSIFAALDHAAFPRTAPPAGSLAARAPDMDATYDAWAIVNESNILGGDRLKALLSGADADADERGFEFGLSLRSGLAVDVSLMFGSESTAKAISGELSRMLKLAVQDKLGEPAMLDLEKRVKFNAQGSVAKLTLRLTPQELEKNAQIFTASRKPQPLPGTNGLSQVRPVLKADQPAAAQPTAKPGATSAAKIDPAPKPERKVIRIDGLDDGPREIPYNENH
jgi:hypothetical protein